MAQRILGLDLGAAAVKAVLLESTFRGFDVLRTATVPLPPPAAPAPDAPDAPPPAPEPLFSRHGAALKTLLEGGAFAFDTAVASFPGAAVSTSVLTLPFTDPRRIEQTVPFEVEGQIPFDLDEVAWDYQPLGARDGRTGLLVAVARREEVAALLAALAGSGVDPRAVVPPAVAYGSLLASGALGPAPEEGASPRIEVVVDLGAERTSVGVFAGGACEAARTFAFGSSHLARALSRELGLSGEDAAALVAADAGGPPLPALLASAAADPRAAETLRRALVPLVRELRATLRAWRARVGPRRIDRLLLAGATARLAGLPDLLAPEVEGPVTPLALEGAAAERIGPAEAPGLALALALSLRGREGARGPRLNLRRGDQAYTRDFEHLKGRIGKLVAWAGLVLLLAVASAGVKSLALARQEAALDRALCDAQQKIVGKCYPNFEEAQAVLRGRGTPGEALPRVSAVDLLGELAAKVPANVPIRLERIEITKDKLHVQGTTDAAENVDRIVEALKGSPCFPDARSGAARRRGTDGKFEFSVDASLSCLESGPPAPGGRG